MAQHEPTLLILAGYSGTGKSTLLTRALKERIPLFGEKLDPVFQGFHVPKSLPEERNAYREIVSWNSWFNGVHLPELANDPDAPGQVLLHLELLHAVTKLPSKMVDASRETAGVSVDVRLSADEQAHLSALNKVFAHPFFKRFRAIAINTVYAPWEITAARWQQRTKPGRAQQSARFYLYDFNCPRSDIHASVYRAWFTQISRLALDVSMLSVIDDDGLTVRDVSGFTPEAIAGELA